MRTCFAGLLLVPLFVAWAPGAEACTCGGGKPACQTLFTSGAIFTGRVESITRIATTDPKQTRWVVRRLVTFTVTEAFHNVDSARVEVQTELDAGACGYNFKPGVEYFVDARRSDTSGQLSVSSCSLTRSVGDASELISFARAAFVEKAPLGRVSGTVTFIELAQGSGRERREPAPGIQVSIEGDGGTWTSTTNAEGRFGVEGLPRGKYAVRIDAPPDMYVSSHQMVELPDARGCVDASAYIAYDGRIAGRVVDATGRPLPGVTIELYLAEQDPLPRRTVSSAEGRFEFERVPAGTFTIAARVSDDRAPGSSRVFHPGVIRIDQAVRTILGAGERQTVSDLVMPEVLRPIILTGVVTDERDVPVPGVSVFLKGPSERDLLIGEPVETDAEGRFRLTVFEGRDYQLFAEEVVDYRALRGSGSATFTADPELRPVTLVLRAR